MSMKECLKEDLEFWSGMLESAKAGLRDAVEHKAEVESWRKRRHGEDVDWAYKSICEDVVSWTEMRDRNAARVAGILKELEAMA